MQQLWNPSQIDPRFEETEVFPDTYEEEEDVED